MGPPLNSKRCIFLKRNDIGFTILELMMAVIVIAILAVLGFPSYLEYQKQVKVADAVADLMTIEQAINRYKVATGHLPPSLQDIGMNILKDPWDRPYSYLAFDTKPPPPPGFKRKDHSLVPVNTDYDLYSKGKDGASHSPFTAKSSQDDVVRANNGGYRGLVENY